MLYGQNDLKFDMLISSEIWTKNDFFKVNSKKLNFLRNVDIYVDMEYSKLRGHTISVTFCGGA